MKCFLDLDGVLVDLMNPVHKFYNIPYNEKEYPYPLGSWDVLPSPIFDKTSEEFWGGLTEEFWATLPWTKDGYVLLNILELIFGQKNICLLTCPTRHSNCIAGKMRWILKELPQYSKQFLIGPTKDFCASEGSILIDDNDQKIDDFEKSGGHTILVPRPWNSNHNMSEFSLNTVMTRLNLYKEDR